MVEYKNQLQRVSHLRCFGMYQCAWKDKVRVRSFGKDDLFLTKKEIFEFADNIKDWCKDMVDPPEEKEECASGAAVFMKEISDIYAVLFKDDARIEKLEKRIETLEDSVDDLKKYMLDLIDRINKVELRIHSDDG